PALLQEAARRVLDGRFGVPGRQEHADHAARIAPSEVEGAAVTRPGQVAGLDARTPLRAAAERLLHARLADLRGAEARAARKLDVRTVHDLRVACRRLRAPVKAFGKKRLRELDERIEHLQDSLGELPALQLETK